MTATHYLSDKLMLIFLNLFCAAVLSLYLTALGNSPAVLLPILAVWAAVLSAVWTMDYLRLKKKYGRISAQLKPVSYTHLDVYKRQAGICGLFHRHIRGNCLALCIIPFCGKYNSQPVFADQERGNQ